jgi:hypothetical protein
MAEQREFAQWSGLPIQELSQYLEPTDVERTRRMIAGIPVEQLPWFQFEGENLFSMALGSWQNRFNVSRPDLKNSLHEQVMRRFMLSASRAYLAARQQQRVFQPDLIVVAGTNDFMSRAIAAAGRATGRAVAPCIWDVSRRAVMVNHPRGAGALPCELLLDGLVDMRADPATWSPMLLGILDELLSFLEISPREHQRAAIP